MTGLRIKIKIVLILAGLTWANVVQAQDTKVSHPFMWKSFNNPGYSGFDGLASVNVGIQRAYWSNPLDFRSYFVSADLPFKGKKTIGLGGVSLLYQRDEESSVRYVTNTFAAAISGRARISRSTVLQLGIQPTLYQKGLDRSRITLGDQFDPYYGQILDLSPELVNFYADKITLFDVSAGIYGKSDFNINYRGIASLEYGFSVYHIIESTQSFLSEHGSVSAEENLLNRRYSGYLSYAHPLAFGNQINTVLSPYLMFESQDVMRNIQFGICWEEERFGLLGFGLRNEQYSGFSIGTFLLHLGVNLLRNNDTGWKIGYTFEVPTHEGTMYKNTTHSLSLHWYFKSSKERCVNRFDHSPNNGRTKMGRKNRTFRF